MLEVDFKHTSHNIRANFFFFKLSSYNVRGSTYLRHTILEVIFFFFLKKNLRHTILEVVCHTILEVVFFIKKTYVIQC